MKSYGYLVSYYFVKDEYDEILKKNIKNNGFGHHLFADGELNSSSIDRMVNSLKEQNGFEQVVILNIVKMYRKK